jgi:cellulose synthase/poly-beta-1,6-N-acetylglucosamine synthase-like glycosyltransferase
MCSLELGPGDEQHSEVVNVTDTSTITPRISVIVPAYNNPDVLGHCLAALRTAASSDEETDAEIIVVDDASTQDIASVAGPGIRLLRLTKNAGPGAARNYGARHARGDVLLFVDADVVVAPGTIKRVARLFAEHPDVAAVFGSYDARPTARGLVSQYRNLLHHFTHQHGKAEAATFWAGCGAIRRSVFNEVGGFDAKRFPRPSIEDIELGYRLRRAHHRIVLDKGLQGTHLKKWRFPSVVWIDVTCRAIPWARLMLESGSMPDDLNLKLGQRLSGGLVGVAFALLALGVFWPPLTAVAALAVLAVVGLNRDLFAFFARQRGLAFAAACVPLHLLYYLYSGLSYVAVWIAWQVGAIRSPDNRFPERGDVR